MKKIIGVATLIALMVACGSQVVEFPIDHGSEVVADAGSDASDTSVSGWHDGDVFGDTQVADAGHADACNTTDTAVADVMVIDSTVVLDTSMDVAVLDTSLPDVVMLDTSMPDVGVLDTSMPDVMVEASVEASVEA